MTGLGHVEPRARSDAFLAAGLQHVRIGAFLLRHRVDQRDLAGDGLVVEDCGIRLLRHLGHPERRIMKKRGGGRLEDGGVEGARK